MDRRKFITISAGGLISSLSGCANTSSTVGDLVEERSQHSGEDDIAVEVSTSGAAILITPTGALPAETVLYQDGERITSTTMNGVGRAAYQRIINCGRANDPGKRLFEPGPIELVFVDESGNEIGQRNWEFRPHPIIKDFTIATVSDYQPDNHHSETTPVFRLQNIGSGPTCLSHLEIKNPRRTVPIGGGGEVTESSMIQTGSYSLSDPRVSLHKTPNQTSTLLPAGRDYYVAIGGLFTDTISSDGEIPPDTPNQIKQTFDMVVHTAYGKSYTTTIDIAMAGGITRPDKSNTWTHRYRTIRLAGTSHSDI